MNSASAALVWEIWRKNRWGFALLVLLLALCFGLRLYVGHLTSVAARLEANPENWAGGTLDPALVLPMSPTGLVAQTLQLGMGSRVIYQGEIGPGDAISWSSVSGKPNWRRVSLGARTLYEGPFPPIPMLSWSGALGKKGSLPLTLSPGDSGEIAWAKTSVERWRQAALVWSVLIMGFSLLVLFAIFAGAEPSSQRGFTGIPPRKFTLPVRTRTLVNWPMTLGSVVIVVLYFGWSWLVLPGLLPAGTAMPHLYLTVLTVAGLAAFQSIVWGLASFPKTRVGLVTVLVFGLIALLALPFLMEVRADDHSGAIRSRLNSTAVPAFVLVGVLSSLVARAGVQMERCGGWFDPSRRFFLLNRIRDWAPRQFFEFGSAFHAQFWLEWRRNGRWAVALWALFLVLLLGSFVGADQLGSGSRSYLDTFGGIALVVGAPWLAIAGLNLARDGSSKNLVLTSFSATRPLATGTLLLAKLMAGAVIWAATMAVLIVGTRLAVGAKHFLNGEPMTEAFTRGLGVGAASFYSVELFGFVPIVFALVISLHIFIGILPLSLTGRIPGFPWSLLPLLMIYGLAANAFTWFFRHGEHFNSLFYVLLLLLLIKLAAGFWGFRRSLALKVISPGFVLAYLAFWLAGTAALVGLITFGAIMDREWPDDTILLISGAALAVPLARIGLAPLALVANRHR